MVVFPLDFEILDESIPIDFKESTAFLSVDFHKVETVSTCRIKIKQIETVLYIE